MSGKYNTKHPERGKSNYVKRLIARGFTPGGRQPEMHSLDWLREHQKCPHIVNNRPKHKNRRSPECLQNLPEEEI